MDGVLNREGVFIGEPELRVDRIVRFPTTIRTDIRVIYKFFSAVRTASYYRNFGSSDSRYRGSYSGNHLFNIRQ